MGHGNTSGQLDGKRRFGVFELDLHAGELRRGGIKVKLQEQPFQVLSLLLEKPGEVVTREELRDRLWRADTFVDFDHGLNAAIKRLRNALGDSADNPTFVETVARRGYRFLAPVSTVQGNGHGLVSVPPPSSLNVQTPARHHRWWLITILCSTVFVVLGLLLGFVLAPHDPVPLRVTLLTANPVDDPVRAAAISRDGRYLAFSDNNGFYLRQIDTAETHPVKLPDGMLATSISWFPDSTHMVVTLTARRGDSSLWELSALGGEARKLLDDGFGPAVSPDGKSIAFVAGKDLRQRIWIAGSGGEQARVVAGTDGDAFGRLAWSPDSQKVAYTTARYSNGKGAKASLDVVNVRGKASAPVTVISSFGLEAAMTWAPDGRLIYSLAEPIPRQADANLWATRLDRHLRPVGSPVRLTNDRGVIFSVGTSGDGKRTLYVKGIPEPDVYVANLLRPGAIDEPKRLTMDDHQDTPYEWTPDNKQVIFVSDRTGFFEVYKQGVDQAVPDLLVSTQHSQLVRLSPDGTQLLFLVYPRWGNTDEEIPLMRAPLLGGAPQLVAKANWISNHQCARAPAKICIFSTIHGNELTFFSFDPIHGQPSQVLQMKDEVPQFFNWTLSPDGATLAIAKAIAGDPSPRIRLVSLKDGSDRWLTVDGAVEISSIDFAADSKGIWAVSGGEKENTLLYMDLQGHARTVWSPKNTFVGWAIPSRDGKHLALDIRSISANVWMLERP
jgi:Tol biopolymer transport system component/DNA-binding winged helix-turn-helix (wHTH) protein